MCLLNWQMAAGELTEVLLFKCVEFRMWCIFRAVEVNTMEQLDS
jgi:hypothetical protein